MNFVRVYERDYIALQREFLDEFSRRPRRVSKKATKISKDKWIKRKRKPNINIVGSYLSPPPKKFTLKSGKKGNNLPQRRPSENSTVDSHFTRGVENVNNVTCWFAAGMQMARHVLQFFETSSGRLHYDSTLTALWQIIKSMNNTVSSKSLSHEEISVGLELTLKEMKASAREQQDVSEFFSCVLLRLFAVQKCDTKLHIREQGFCMNVENEFARVFTPHFENSFTMSSIPVFIAKPSLQHCVDDFFIDEYSKGYNCLRTDCKSNLLMKSKAVIRTPKAHIFHLKRYTSVVSESGGLITVKNNQPLEFPPDVIIQLKCDGSQVREYEVLCRVSYW